MCVMVFHLFQATSTMHEPATATVLISINDTNDNSPFFPNDHQTGSVLENSLSYSKIMQAKAVDLDEVLVNFSFAIISQSFDQFISHV